MRTITTTAGTPVEVDGDVLAVIEAISRDLTRRKELEYGFDDVDREFQHLVRQLTDAELRVYLKESLFMSFNRFENDRMLAIMKKADRAIAAGMGRTVTAPAALTPAKTARKTRAAAKGTKKTTQGKSAGTSRLGRAKRK
jgi:hypothetical protein